MRRPAALGNYRRFSCAYPATGGCCNAADIVRSRVAIPYSGYTVFISLCYACSTVVFSGIRSLSGSSVAGAII